MKNKIKRIINLIILIMAAIGIFIFTKNIPNFLIAKESTTDNNKITNLETIEKIEETAQAMILPDNALFPVNNNTYRAYKIGDEDYHTVIVPHISPQIYCISKGLHMNPSGYSYEEISNVVNQAKSRMRTT